MTRIAMVGWLVFIVTSVSGCASRAEPEYTELRKWVGNGPNPGQAGLSNDAARCDYEVQLAARSSPNRPHYTAPNSGPYAKAFANVGAAMMVGGNHEELFESCMRARGWQYMGTKRVR